jgi:hypothetical protein
MMATVGQGSASMTAMTAWALRTISSACAASLRATNSLTSAPAMNPLVLAERITRPRSVVDASAFRCESSSSSASRDRTLVELPGLSKVSQAMPSASTSRAQAAAAEVFMARTSGYGGLRRHRAANREVAEDRTVIRETHVGHLEVGDLDFLAHQHEVEFDSRNARRE